MPKSILERLYEKIEAEAARLRDSAAFAGARDDGGASRMLRDIHFFKSGMRGEIPPEWRQYVDEVRKEDDPEYAEYLRLREKFDSG